MEINMDVCLENLDDENIELNGSLRNLKVENGNFLERIHALENALKKEKKIHQAFVDDAAASEAMQLEDFQNKTRIIVEDNKALVKENRQLKKDKDFYKYAHEELASVNEEKSTVPQSSTLTEQWIQQSETTSSSKSTRQSFSQTVDLRSENEDIETMHFSNSIKDLEAENNCLMERVNQLEKTLDKERKFHRKFSDDIAASEAVRHADFRKEKRDMVEQNKSLAKENRQLKKDKDFYKNEHDKLAKEEKSKQPITASSSKATRRSASQANVSNVCTCTHKSSKVLSAVNTKLFEENKKLKFKINNLNGIIAILKKKNLQLENFRTKVDNKKAKFCQDSEELARLVDSSLTKNKHTFNPEALVMLGRFSHK